ncbi:hypothetical protein [Halosegnis longus]|uniref:hypothetical protein n=1 Tax=Halosegnis longus TaxID=2216012 RepID=UPI00096A91FF|nr:MULTISPECIES: hypothetical protein [Halobacteriales]
MADDTTERALAVTREALANVTQIPAAALSGDQHAAVSEVAETLGALEKELTNEAEQQRGEE